MGRQNVRRWGDKESPAGEGWTEVIRRPRQTSTRWDNNSETTFFIENLPEEATNNNLWKLFGKVGRLSDAYIAKKKDAAGNRFGFIRFWNVKDVDGILQKANEVRVNEAVVKVSLARFDRYHRKITHSVTDHPRKQVPFQQAYPTVARGGNLGDGRRFAVGGMSYKDAVKNQSTPPSVCKTVKLNGEEGLLQRHWIGKSVIGESKGVGKLMEVQKALDEMGLKEAGIMYVGGMKMLMSFHDKGQALEFINNRKEKRGEFFESARLWNGEDLPMERTVKLYITGVPLQLRDDETFNEIGKAFGRVVGRSEFSWSKLDVSVGSCIVVINQWTKIDEVIRVEWKSRSFDVKVVEEDWKPDFDIASGLEEGEFRHTSPEKMEKSTGTPRDKEGGRVEGEELHGESKDFNAKGQNGQEFNYDGGSEDFVVGVDPIRKKKRRRTGNTNSSGPVNAGNGLFEEGSGNRNVPMGQEGKTPSGSGTGYGPGLFCFGANREEGCDGQTQLKNDERAMDKESSTEGELRSREDDADVVMETVFPSGNSEANGVEEEVNKTIQTGEILGVRLEGFKKEVENLVNGDGVIEGSQ